MALDKREKETQLKELTSIVTGIRLFNRDCGKGGQGIDDCECRGRDWGLELGWTGDQHVFLRVYAHVQCYCILAYPSI